MEKNSDDWTESSDSNCSITDKVLEILDEEEKRIKIKKRRSESSEIESNERSEQRKKSSSVVKSRSNSRSRKNEQNSKNLERIRSRSRSRYNRSRSSSKSRSRSYSNERYRVSRSRNYSRGRKRSRSRSRHRRKSRSYSRHRKRSRSYSTDGKYKNKRNKSRSRSRSHSRNYYRKRRSRSRTRSKSRSYEKMKEKSSFDKSSGVALVDININKSIETSSPSKIVEKTTESTLVNDNELLSRSEGSVAKKSIEIKLQSRVLGEKSVKSADPKSSLYGKWEKYEQPVKNPEINKLTNLCREISAKEGYEDSEDKIENNSVSHPFQVAPPSVYPMFYKGKPTNPAQAIMAGSLYSIAGPVDPPKTGPLENYFPVSSGSEHHKLEGHGQEKLLVYEPVEPEEHINVSAVIARRLGAQQILNSNPDDFSAKAVLAECDLKLKKWSDQNKKPGKFTGTQLGTRMNKHEIVGAVETWVRKDFFHNLQPVTGGVGMRMMQKMGWQQGRPLGKKQEGFLAPIAVDIKVGRGGLYSADEQPQFNVWNGKLVPKRRPPAPVANINGKHPVSALAELCVKRKLGIPDYTCVFEHGLAQNKNFLMKVTVANVDYQASVASPNKKHAKANAAIVALRAMGEAVE
ncbi:protein SON isoform X1 [Hydra vulgaris]|uniref:protein SON isoform X1 n=1 Tax=Hydra vulgaris TaxID=6087 RepID=UPI00019252F9|nr:protein SON [Hydra vulgaris]